MKSIKLISQDKSHQMNSYYELDYGLFRVDANVYSNAYSINESIKEIYEHDIHDIEFDFYVNGKRCKYEGFKELYNKLFGDKFKDFIVELEEKVSSKYLKDTIYTDINSISSNLASEYLDRLIAANNFKSSTMIIDGKKLLYTDVRYIRLLAKKAGKLDIFNCKSVNNPDGPTKDREVYIIDIKKA